MSASQIPGYVSGTWTIDPAHSEVGFVVRHLMVSKVRGQFTKFEGSITTAPDPMDSAVSVTVFIDMVEVAKRRVSWIVEFSSGRSAWLTKSTTFW